ncbi:BspA family leucine-rich repeat surface protein [Listeria monocytogenes]|nr:BspA family leucine-rich repeat surface protein [Listeria monocytogenes]EHC6526192.1 BspA family leucine-rich repeat surface protein [Listeria monocytogenes]
MKRRKKSMRQLVVAFLLLYTIGLPIQNIVLANELSPTEEVVTEETESATTAETDTSNSESMESESVPLSEKEAESTEITSSEIVLEESKVLTGMPEVESSEITEASSATQQSEERPSTKFVSSGTFPNGSTATWNFDDVTGTLSISGGTLVDPGKRWLGATSCLETLTGVADYKITNIVLEGKVFASGNCDGLFSLLTARALSIDLSNFDTSNVTSMDSMFYANYAVSIDVSNFDTSQVTNMFGMFESTSYATSLDVSNFDTSKVTNMSGMFWGSAATSLDVSSFDTSQVSDMSYMFAESAATSLDLSSFDTSQVSDMGYMFDEASQLQNLTLGSQFQFGGTDAMLPDPTPTAKYTGEWQNVGSGTVNKPKGSFIGTATELMSNYTGSTMADTYVWQPILLEVNVQDSILMVGDTWNPANNFLSALDSVGDPVDFRDITVTGSVDTTQPGVTTVDYSYGGMTSIATITVLETMPASWINFFVDGTNVRSISGSALSVPEWDLTTGLWDKWNPGTVKVPTDKVPSEPTKQGYEFKGWEDTAGTIVDFSTLDLDLNSQNEFDFYAAFEKKEYTVTFDVEGKQEQEGVLFEELITEPTVPNKAGYAFTGWYDAKTGGTKWDFSTDTMPAGNVTLYARFNKLGFVTPGVNPITPNVEPPTKPGERPNLVTPSTPGAGGNQTPSNGSGLNTGNTAATSPITSQGGNLAKLGENNSLLLQVVGLLLVLSGVAFFLVKRRKTHS